MKGILVNIFGGIMRCDIIAEGVVAAVKEVGLQVPLVVRLEGTNVELGKEIIAKSGLNVTPADDLDDAAQKIVEAVKGRRMTWSALPYRRSVCMFVGAAHANERSAELVKSFQAFCAAAPLDFAALDAKATAMNLAVRKDVGTPQQTGKFARSKSWLVPLDSRRARA